MTSKGASKTTVVPRGRKAYDVGGVNFVIDDRYELIKQIGHGAYGVVISASDARRGKKVAIKKISNAFEDLIDAKRILREIKLLRKGVFGAA